MAESPGSRSGRRSRQASRHFPTENATSTLLLSTGFGSGGAGAASDGVDDEKTGLVVAVTIFSSDFGLLSRVDDEE